MALTQCNVCGTKPGGFYYVPPDNSGLGEYEMPKLTDDEVKAGPLKYEILSPNGSVFSCAEHLGKVVSNTLAAYGPVEVKDV